MSQVKRLAMGSSSFSSLLRRAFSTSTAIKSISDDLYRTRDQKKLAEKFLTLCEDERFRKKTDIYEEVVRRLSGAGRFKLVKKVLDSQKKYTDISKEAYGVRLISLYGRSGMLSDALHVFDEMPKLNSPRTVLSVNAVLSACVYSKKYSKAEEMFRKLPAEVGVEPDVVTYNTLIKAKVEMGFLDKAVSVLDEMKKKGCNPDRVTYNTLLHGLYKRDQFADGEKIWDKMQESGLTPDIRSYNAKLAGLASEKKAPQALELIEEMKVKGLNPDIFSFNLLIKAYCNEGNLEEAKKWYEELTRNGCKPDKVTYATLLPFVCDNEDIDFALGLCKNIFRDHCLVNLAVLQRVVDELVVLLKFDEAKELLELGKSNKYCNYKLKMPLDP